MGASCVFNQLFKCYQREQAVSAGAGPDGLSCEPCWLPQPPPCSCRSILVLYRTHCLWGEQKAAGDSILQFILCLQGVASGAPTGSQPWKYNLWGHCGF